MKLDIKNFIPQGVGYKEEYDLEEKVHFDDFQLLQPIRLHVILIRLKDGIDVAITDLETEVAQTCSRCLKKTSQKVRIPGAERIFYFKKQPKFDLEADQADIFMVDLRHQQVDLTELLRQEILLHFSSSPVCSKSCKGLTDKYQVESNQNNPFKKLLNPQSLIK